MNLFLPIEKTTSAENHIAFSKIMNEILTELNKDIPELQLEKVPYKDVSEYKLLKEMPDLAIPLYAYDDDEFQPESRKKNSEILLKEFDNIVKNHQNKHELSEDELNKLVNTFLPTWQEGKRHEQAYIIAIIMRKRHIPQYQTEEFIEKICDQAEDEEKEDRLKCVEDVYAIPEDRLY